LLTDQELKEQQRRQWGGNAGFWDDRHERLERDTQPITPWLCRGAALVPGNRVLDLACGSGHPALEEARLVRPGGTVVATDLTPEMVEVTLRRAREAGLNNLEARVMDAENIEFPDESFDAVTMRFGLMFCPQPERATSEIFRVLRPGGRLAVSVWDEASRNPVQTILGQALASIGRPNPVIDLQVPGPFRLAGPGVLQNLFETTGFKNVQIEQLSVTWDYATLDEYWHEQQRSPVLRTLLNEGSAAEIEDFKAEVFSLVEPYTSADGVRVPASFLCAVGEK
jgi:ubiquinone/menaquinone biosynthesis C-methylase UbiE